jgi:crotonobetaine/carnitine-CoA ligase
MMLGYLHRPDATAAAFDGDFYRTGDAVIRHPDGEFEFIDRLRDTIRRHGENISSSMVEAVVATDPTVAVCAVLGVPDPVAGQEVLLAVVPSTPQFQPGELWERLRQHLPRHALPAYVVVRAALPLTPTGKVRKTGLLDQLDLSSAWRPGL